MIRDALKWALMALLALVLFTGVLPVIGLSFGRLRAPLIDRLVRLWGRAGLWLSGVQLEVVGEEHLRHPRPRVVVFNHTSVLDVLVAAALSPPRMMIVLKSSLRWFFPFNVAFALVGAIYVDRRTPGGSVEAMRRAAKLVHEQARSFALAPEGTRSRSGRLGPFKTGAFHVAQQAKAEMVPVVIHGAFELCPAHSLRVKPGVLRVQVKPPLPPPDDTDDPRSCADALHARYLQWLEP